ncbi:phenylacetate-CoA oxygenase subunit PaaI [Bacillus sp. FJAT-29953]|nr:phenylacetate-CoA oxygenase subunit PaaI [Bacillus sp. FJAT-29953]
MADKKNDSLIVLAETIADNKFITGDRLVEIGISGPTLEASLSSIAMAQAELGHARLMYKWSNELQGLNASKMEVKEQTGKAFPALVNASNWLSLIAGLYANNQAVDLVIKAILKAEPPNLPTPFNKMIREQQEHLLYAKSWCKQLLRDRGAVPRVFKQHLEKAAAEVEQWLVKVEKDPQLQSEAIILNNSNLVKTFKSEIEQLTNFEEVQHV